MLASCPPIPLTGHYTTSGGSSVVEGVEVTRRLHRLPEGRFRLGRKLPRVDEAIRPQVGEDESSHSRFVGHLTSFGRRRVSEGVRPLCLSFRTVGLVDEEVRVPGVLDDILARAGVGGVDHRRASLLYAEADALQAVIHLKGRNVGVAGPGRSTGD